MSNILFVLYHDFTANSAVHVHNFANELAALGHHTAVAIPYGENTGTDLGEQEYCVRFFPQIDGDWAEMFENGQPPDIVHAWTPRENVRLLCEKLRGLCNFILLVHLEDNEEIILEANLGRTWRELANVRSAELPGNLSHPRTYRAFIASAHGVTLIIDRLEKFVPAKTPKLVLWPGANRDLFFARPKDEQLLARLGIPRENLVFCYTGNVHSANAREVRSLYLAAAILNREGVATSLLRAGTDYAPFLGPDETWAREISVELGQVRHVDVPQLLALADILIQPGTDDAFNEYRLPAKLPEFFAMGRPVILPRTNVGRFVRHGEEAWILPKVNALRIVDAVQELRAQPDGMKRLAEGALRFCEKHFDWTKNARALEQFYAKIGSTEAVPS